MQTAELKPDVKPMAKRWYIVHAYSNFEKKVQESIREQAKQRHLDHLFDEGYITFSSNQELLIVPEVRDKLLDAWGIDAGVRVGEFSPEQGAYLDYHRVNVFKHSLLER